MEDSSRVKKLRSLPRGFSVCSSRLPHQIGRNPHQRIENGPYDRENPSGRRQRRTISLHILCHTSPGEKGPQNSGPKTKCNADEQRLPIDFLHRMALFVFSVCCSPQEKTRIRRCRSVSMSHIPTVFPKTDQPENAKIILYCQYFLLSDFDRAPSPFLHFPTGMLSSFHNPPDLRVCLADTPSPA